MSKAPPAALMRKATVGAVAPGASEAVAAANSSAGEPLPSDMSYGLQNALGGTNLSSVRVHTGVNSAAAAAAVSARAFTQGSDIHFAAGEYDPASKEGQRLISHEVAHTVQQRGVPRPQLSRTAVDEAISDSSVSQPSDTHERQADAFADAFVGGSTAQVPVTKGSAPAAKLARKPKAPGARTTTESLTITQPPDIEPGGEADEFEREANRPQTATVSIDKALLKHQGTEFLRQLEIRAMEQLLPKYGYKQGRGDIRRMLAVASVRPGQFWSWDYVRLRKHIKQRHSKNQPAHLRIRNIGRFLKRWESFQTERKRRFAKARAQRHNTKGLTEVGKFAGWLVSQWWDGAVGNDPVLQAVGNASDFAQGVFDGVYQWLEDMKGMVKELGSLIRQVATSILENSLFMDLLSAINKVLQVDAKQLLNAIIPGLGDLGKQWKSWRFRGKLVGYILAEALATGATGLAKIGIRVTGKAAARGAELVESIRNIGVIRRVEAKASVLAKTGQYSEKVKEAAAGMIKAKGGKAGSGKSKLGTPAPITAAEPKGKTASSGPATPVPPPVRSNDELRKVLGTPLFDSLAKGKVTLVDIDKLATELGKDYLEHLLQVLKIAPKKIPKLLKVSSAGGLKNLTKRFETLKKKGVKGDLSKIERDSMRDMGAIGELDAMERWIREGKKVESLPEIQNSKWTNPDFLVDNRVTEVKTTNKPADSGRFNSLLDKANTQFKRAKPRSGRPVVGDVDIQFIGDEAKKILFAKVEEDLLRQFRPDQFRNVQQVSVHANGKLVGVWERSHGVIKNTYKGRR